MPSTGLSALFRSLAKAMLGIVLLATGFFVLVWGEARVNLGHAVSGSHPVTSPVESDGDPVTVTGVVEFDEPADDPLLDGEFAWVRREAETCAWIEISARKSGGKPRYSKQWVAEVADSELFTEPGHDNRRGAFESKESTARGLRVGEFGVSLVTEVMGVEPMPTAPGQVRLARTSEAAWAYLAPTTRCSESGLAAVGDQRLRFSVIREGDVATAFGRASGRQIIPFRGQVVLSSGDRQALLDRSDTAREGLLWAFRGGGALLLWIALYFILSPVMMLVGWIPLVGDLVRGAATLLTLLVALAAALALVFGGFGLGFFTILFGGLLE